MGLIRRVKRAAGELLPEQVSPAAFPGEQLFLSESELLQSSRADSLPPHWNSELHIPASTSPYSAPWRTEGAPQPSSLQTTVASCRSKSPSHTGDHCWLDWFNWLEWLDLTSSWPEHRLLPFSSLTESAEKTQDQPQSQKIAGIQKMLSNKSEIQSPVSSTPVGLHH